MGGRDARRAMATATSPTSSTRTGGRLVFGRFPVAARSPLVGGADADADADGAAPAAPDPGGGADELARSPGFALSTEGPESGGAGTVAARVKPLTGGGPRPSASISSGVMSRTPDVFAALLPLSSALTAPSPGSVVRLFGSFIA